VRKLIWLLYGYAPAYNAFGAFLLMKPSRLRLWWDFFPPITPTRLWFYTMGVGPAVSTIALVLLMRCAIKGLFADSSTAI